MFTKDILKGRINDLSLQCYKYEMVTSLNFLSASEKALFFDCVKELKGNEYEVNGVKYFLFGGYEDADRQCVFFLPDYLDYSWIEDNNDNLFVLYHFYPKNEKFANELTHRDYLGALMNLGLEREMFGDILVKGNDGYVIALQEVKNEVPNLTKIGHNDVLQKEILLSQLPIKREYELKDINIASNRLDCIICEVFNLARDKGQDLIKNECVFVNGKTIISSSYEVKENERISIKGFGKFVFEGINKITRKERLACEVKLYK